MKKLKLHLASVAAAGQAVGKKAEEIQAIKRQTFADSGLESKQDYDLFDFMFNDALGHCESLAKQLLPSEAAAVKVTV